jgi:hypothetical protein
MLASNAALRDRAQRAMKLVLIASVWVTGLFVVIAAVTMVAMATGPIATTTGATTLQKGLAGGHRTARIAGAGADLRNGGHDQPGGEQAGAAPAGSGRTGHSRTGQSRPGGSHTHQSGAKHSTLATSRPSAPTMIHAVYAHTGSANTSPFTIGGNGTWKLAWSYDCAGLGSEGSFSVSQDGTGNVDGAYITRFGAAGHGVTWAYQDAGTHYLAVRTQCQWQITVTSQP